MKVEPKFTRTVKAPRTLLTPEEIKSCDSVSSAIRLCIKKYPDAKDREISDFLELGRPQWVNNVRKYQPKRK